MKLSAALAFVFLVFKFKVTLGDSRKYMIPLNCSEVYSTVHPRYVAYDEPYRVRNWVGRYTWKVRTNQRIENRVVHHTRPKCCSGYSKNDYSLCSPVCTPTCGQYEVCTKPDTCECVGGYRKDPTTNQCTPVCDPECGENSECDSPGVCVCKEGYRMLLDGRTCVPVCQDCTDQEFCVEPHVCRCLNGYTRASIDRLDRAEVTECKATCDRECVHADCIRPNVCECHAGYENLDDDDFTCEPRCTLGCRDGTCTGPEVCSCFPGYKLGMNAHLCEPICKDDCGNGECIAPDICSCKPGYVNTGDNGPCKPFCESNCPNGRCVDPNRCSCDPGYRPADNETSCEPICTEACVMGNCTGPDTCTCFDGYGLRDGSATACEPLCASNCPNARCVAPDECLCDEGYEKKNSTDDCTIICKCDNGHCNDTSPACDSCSEGYDLSPEGKCQPHCDSECGPGGRCAEPQVCECDQPYRLDNDTCVHACGGDCNNGTCDVDNATCSCDRTWTGEHCDVAVFCSLTILEDQPCYQLFNESVNLAVFEYSWHVPICHEECLKEVTNATECYYATEAQRDLLCFVDINSPCNYYDVVQANAYRKEMDVASVVVYCSSGLVLVVIGSLVAYFVLKKRRSSRSMELMKTVDATVSRCEKDCLIDNDNYSVLSGTSL